MESSRCLTALRMTTSASSSPSSCPASICAYFNADCSLRRGFRINRGERVLVVEDVVTTGKSMRETARVIAEQGGLVFGFASILNRSGVANPFDAPYEALLKLDLETYEASDCPLCKTGV